MNSNLFMILKDKDLFKEIHLIKKKRRNESFSSNVSNKV
jgi:hypothetical protein